MEVLNFFVSAGAAKCSLSDVAVTQTTISGQIGGYPEYYVTVLNGCICTQSDVKLACPGFNSSMYVNPDIIRPDADGKLCTLNGGGAVRNGDVIKFYYAWSTRFSFAPVSSTISCS